MSEPNLTDAQIAAKAKDRNWFLLFILISPLFLVYLIAIAFVGGVKAMFGK